MVDSLASLSARATEAIERVGGVVLWPLDQFERLSGAIQDRLVGIMLALPSIAVLAIALSLEPASEGVGTHRQLGLGACTMLSLTGIPCPMCGMTTTFAHLAHAHLIQGAITQPFGVVLFSLTLFGAILGGADLLRPGARWRIVLRWIQRNETGVAVALLGGMMGGWIYKIIMMRG